MRIAVIGSRKIEDYEWFSALLNKVVGGLEGSKSFVSGGSEGIDSMVHKFSKENGLDSFADLGRSIKKIMAQTIAQSITADLFKGVSLSGMLGAGSGGAGGGITDIFSGLSSVKSFSDIGSLLSSSSLASSPVAAAGLSYMLASAIPADLFNLGGKAKGNEVGGEIGNFFGIGGKVLGSAFGSFIGPGRAHPASTFGGNFGSGGFSNVGVEYKHIGAEIGQGAAEALAVC